ncbi:HAMP domain-containing histidine kinase [Rheinheimera sp. D18]|uniref:sensor histidine kinase n=1 Tax=Rheinheimera sp. D18 TaxID=2545632 RepID=UPI001042C5CC|nr:HAMP domain-containing sensor histidine kinase [Rheinheimera sp. D18]QBL10467.1 HAMP domain-containing histidine kinase [Rheinheimera sp. D18]
MKPTMSLQRRLSIGLTLGVVLLWLVVATATSFIVNYALNKTLDSSLAEVAQRILSLAAVEILNRETPDRLQQVVSLQPHDEYITYLVRSANGTPLLKSHDVDLSVFPKTPQLGLRSSATHRLYGTSAIRDTIFIEVAEPLAARSKAQWQAVMLLQLPLIILIPLSLIGIWWFVKHSLNGVLAFSNAIETRGAGDLSLVKGASLPAEIVPIAEAVNHLLERLHRALAAERSFTANSAHELRTPLAAALAQVQRLRHEAGPGPLAQRAGRIEQALRELSLLSEKLMQLAKAEGSGVLIGKSQDITHILHHVVDEFRRTVGLRLRLSLPEASAVLSIIDSDALAILTRNLIENALKHGAAEQVVDVELTADGTLRIVNAGPIVPAEELVHLTERFVRSTTRASGSGLGLAIAQAIANGAGTTLVLTSPATGREQGFEVSIKLP